MDRWTHTDDGLPGKMKDICSMKRLSFWLAVVLWSVSILVLPSLAFIAPLQVVACRRCHSSICGAEQYLCTEDNLDSSPEKYNFIQPIETTANGTVASQHEMDTSLPLTSAVLRISYDGSRFTGWSAANGATNSLLLRPSRRRRRRGAVGDMPQSADGFVRSVECVVRENLAMIYGNVDAQTRIVVEGCSRTDRGVHATGMIAHFYCLKESAIETDGSSSDSCNTNSSVTIPGKRKPHPASPSDDSSFEPLPMNGSLSRIAFALNRMRPSDVEVTGIAPTPQRDARGNIFHASLSSHGKTYEYKISTGYLNDPTLRRFVWHVGYSNLDLDKMKHACQVLEGTHNFAAFQGAPRGPDDKRRRLQKQGDGTQSVGSTCSITSIEIVEVCAPIHVNIYFTGIDPPLRTFGVVVKGDRFLYKMVRFLVGTLVAVGYGKLDLEDIQRALETGRWEISDDQSGRRKQFECAPPHGLVLKEVDYGDIPFDWRPLREVKN
jgi:tRNA pseudouridine38-40 synthase